MELSKYIKEILISRDNVVIPNFGTFEKTMLSARFDTVSGEMFPPQIGVVFNSELKTDSDVLVQYIAEKESIAQDKIIEEIQVQVQLWEDSLNQSQQVLIEGIGTLTKDITGTINFESAITASDFPESFGLPVINILDKPGIVQPEVTKKEEPETEQKKVEQKKVEQKKNIAKQNVKVISEPKESKPFNTRLAVLLVFAALIIALVVFVFLKLDYVKQKYADTSKYVSGLISNKNEPDTLNKPIVEPDSLNVKDSSDLETKEVLENYTIIDESTNTKITPESENINSFKKVYIIAGSFKKKNFAKRHCKDLIKKGFSAEVLPENKGLYRVSVASFDDAASAAKDFDRIKAIDESQNFWILINK